MDISLASTGGAALEGHSALLPLSVLDVNDENPTFFPAVYNVSLPENVARDFKVVRLNCTDADVGLNAELSYFITGRNPLQNCSGELCLWKGAACPGPWPGCSAHQHCLLNLVQHRPLLKRPLGFLPR